MLVGSWLLLLFDYETVGLLEYEKDSIINLGYFRKNVLFSYYYGSKILEGD